MIEKLSDKEVHIVVCLLVIGVTSFLLGGSFISIVKGASLEELVISSPKTEEKEVEVIKELDRDLAANEIVMNSLAKSFVASFEYTDIKYNELDKEMVFLSSMAMLINDLKYTKTDTATYFVNSEDVKGYAYRVFNYSDFLYKEDTDMYKYDSLLGGYTFNLSDTIISDVLLTEIIYNKDKTNLNYFNKSNNKSYLITFINENNVYRIINFVIA